MWITQVKSVENLFKSTISLCISCVQLLSYQIFGYYDHTTRTILLQPVYMKTRVLLYHFVGEKRFAHICTLTDELLSFLGSVKLHLKPLLYLLPVTFWQFLITR